MTACPFCGRAIAHHDDGRACNPLLAEFTRALEAPTRNHFFRVGPRGTERASRYDLRQELANRYSWGIPNEEAMACLSELAPIVEIGAGTGYWAALLLARDVSVYPFDAVPPRGAQSRNIYHLEAKPWADVAEGSSEVLTRFATTRDTLFLCWPPYAGTTMARDCLRAFRGRSFVHVGEHDGESGAREFFAELRSGWRLKREVTIPQWEGVHDSMTVWERK